MTSDAEPLSDDYRTWTDEQAMEKSETAHLRFVDIEKERGKDHGLRYGDTSIICYGCGFLAARARVRELERQVDAARTALEGFADLDQVSPMYGGIAARARAALAGTEGGSPE